MRAYIKLLLALVACILSLEVEAQGFEAYFEDAGVDASEENSVFLLLIIFFAINFVTPFLTFLYRNYVTRIVDHANTRLSEIQQSISERISDAGRKLSDKVRS
jgi:hypothetical protein